MRKLIRRSLRGRRGQVLALAITMAFSAVLIGALSLMTETGVRGQVSTGEYDAAPVLVGAQQTRPVRDDVDMPVPERALMRASVVDEVQDALPGARVVTDVIVPAVVRTGRDRPASVEVHPWSATALGDRTLASGHAPEDADEIALSEGVVESEHLALGDDIDVGFGDEAEPHTVVGIIDADDSGTDVADAYVTDDHARVRDASEERTAVIGVWPEKSDDVDSLEAVATNNRARLWSGDERGDIEVVRQGPAKGALVSAAAAFGALGIIVSVFTLIVITSLQVRERSRELAVLRVVGATPRQVKRLLRGEVRTVTIVASAVGALLGPFIGAGLVRLLQSWAVIPRGLDPVFGPLSFVTAFGVAVVSAEVAARVSLRRIARGSPLAGLEGADERRTGSMRTMLGVAGVGLGLAMACAPLYTSGEAAAGLAGLAGLVVAISLGPLSPMIVRVMTWTQRRRAGHSAPRHLALASLSARSARVGGALTPIVLGVTLSYTQLFSGSTTDAIATDQVEAGHHADVLITGPTTGVGDDLADDVTAIPGVASVDSVVTTDVLIRGNQHDANWQSLRSLAVAEDDIEQYASLRPVDAETVDVADQGVALSTQLTGSLGADEGDDLEIVLPDGRTVERRVTGSYERGAGFGDVVLPIGDLEPATASGRTTALAVTVHGDGAPVSEVKQQIETRLETRPGLELTEPTNAMQDEDAAADVAFPVLLLLILWGYIAIAVVNSLVITTLSRRTEFACLRVVGATPAQQRQAARWEAAFLAGTGCLVATLAALPGLCGLTYALSNGERILPGIGIVTYAVVVTTSFILVIAATELATRSAMRVRGVPS